MTISAPFALITMSVISSASLLVGFELLSPKPALIPIVITLFKHFVAIATCHSVTYAFIFRPPRANMIMISNTHVIDYLSLLLLVILPAHFFVRESKTLNMCLFTLLILANYAYMFLTNQFSSRRSTVNFSCYWIFQACLFLTGAKYNHFYWDLVMLVSTFTAASLSPCMQHDLPNELITQNLRSTWERVVKQFVTFSRVELWGAVLFPICFQLSTSGQVVAFLFLALSWISNMALVSASHDFGVLRFVLNELLIISAVHIANYAHGSGGLIIWIFIIAACLFLDIVRCWITYLA